MDSKEPWNEWLSKYGKKLVLYARQFAHSHTEAEDMVQEGFLRFWKSKRRNEKDPVSRLFFYVRNAALDLLRSEKSRKGREAAFQKEADLWFEPDMENREFMKSAQKAMESLPQEQREILVMKIWGDLTFDQIAKVLKMSANTAASRYRYAVEKMERLLKHERN